MRDTCFICQHRHEITEEHVFPKWLQRKFNLWNESIVLKNKSRIRYKDLKIPCCAECNKYLSKIESRISDLISRDDIHGLNADTDTLFIWLYKIMYGINYKELFLLNDRKDTNSESIVSIESHNIRSAYSLFLRFVRNELIFEGFSPYSLFVFRITNSEPNKYFFASEPYLLFASIIIGNLGIIVSFQDDGYISDNIEQFDALGGRSELTLPEFGDFAAFILHLKMRMKSLPNYLIELSQEGATVRMQESKKISKFRVFHRNKQLEITKSMFSFCFQELIQDGENGHKEIRYTSPFKYF